ncbi:NUDIX hydrolase (fragment) [Candidatus Nitrosocosmicus franklandus]|uniref:NUDIX hydrolase n=1 Tax=Candidatus Nitrosocosmicus franklandianus TaxID=1798806 RepID=A0A484IHE1_9ARCH
MVLSGGFVRMGETIKEAVMREVKEETYLDVSTWIIYWVFIPILIPKRSHCVHNIYWKSIT